MTPQTWSDGAPETIAIIVDFLDGIGISARPGMVPADAESGVPAYPHMLRSLRE
jgi:hypothetical protein